MNQVGQGNFATADTANNLLTDRILTVDNGRSVSLPEMFAGLATGEISRVSKIRAHQRTAWHMFTAQLAALALRHAGRTDLPETAADWTQLLRALSNKDSGADTDEPWELVVADRKKPAFMQPPDPSGLKWSSVPTPDALDLLITSRNHDLKREVAISASPEDWVFALVSLQTMEGFGGRNNYGIARMNGGFSSRAFLGLVPAKSGKTMDAAAWWRRDVAICRDAAFADTRMTPGATSLIWCHEWPESHQFSVGAIDPLAIEVCRRVRLRRRNVGLIAERAGSKLRRVDADEFRGVLGDPWAPVSMHDATPKTLTLSEGQFDYRRMAKLLFDDKWKIPTAAELQNGESASEMCLLAEALARGNSKTFGLRSRSIPLPKKAVVAGLFGRGKGSAADAADQQLNEVKSATKALADAIGLYAVEGDRDVFRNPDRKKTASKARETAAPACARLDAAVDRVFFDYLWARADVETADASRHGFRAMLVEKARDELARAFQEIPCASVFAAKARVRAQSRLGAALRRAELIESEAGDV